MAKHSQEDNAKQDKEGGPLRDPGSQRAVDSYFTDWPTHDDNPDDKPKPTK